MRVFSAIVLLLFLLSCSSQNAPNDPTEKNRYDKWIEDINFFENEFLDAAKTYTEDARSTCQSKLSQLKKDINNLSDFQIQLELIQCVVLADNGHTSMSLPATDDIPLRFYRFSDGVYVVKTDSAHAQHLGAKVLKINSVDIKQVEAGLFPYISGINRWKKFKVLNLITAPKLLYEIGIGEGKEDSLSLTLSKNAETFQISVGTKKIENDRYWFESWANLYPLLSEENPWVFLKKDTSNLPLYLKNAEEGVFYHFDSKENLAYFHINSFWEKCPDFKGRIEAFHDALKEKRDYEVVIDLRYYTGGNYAKAIKLANQAPKIIDKDKKIYLITSNKTYSAGIVTAARIKHFAKDKIVIVGEEVGDRLYFWAESERLSLPNNGARIYNSKKEHDWKDNKRRISKTHLPNYIYGVAAKELKVDQEIGLSFQEYIENKDPILEWIIAQK